MSRHIQQLGAQLASYRWKDLCIRVWASLFSNKREPEFANKPFSKLNSIPFSVKPIYFVLTACYLYVFDLLFVYVIYFFVAWKGTHFLIKFFGIKNGIQKWLNLDLTGLRLPLQIFCKKVQKRAENQRNAFDTVTKGKNDFWRSIDNYYLHYKLLQIFNQFSCKWYKTRVIH